MGNDEGLPERLDPEDEAAFPGLVRVGYRVSSRKDTSYNCAAYAADDLTRKWQYTVIPVPGYYWPNGAEKGDEPDALKSAYETIGYEICLDGQPEDGYDKIAIYVDNLGLLSHAAKLHSNGEWSSKLGPIEDIRHKSEHCFGDSEYGSVIYYMRRKS